MKIKPNQDFLDEGKRFKKGRRYDVSTKRAAYFRENGWLEGTDPKTNGEASLEIHDINHGQEASF